MGDEPPAERIGEKPTEPNFTHLIQAWKTGDEAALEEITACLHSELRRLAGSYLRRERPGHTLQATALVNEAWIRLAGLSKLEWKDRAHFIGIAAHLMRQILMQHARSKHAQKRGGEARQVPLEEVAVLGGDSDEDLIALDDALVALAEIDERKSRIVEMRYFAGMEMEEIAEATGSSVSTVGRQLRFAQAWLKRHISGEDPNGGGDG